MTAKVFLWWHGFRPAERDALLVLSLLFVAGITIVINGYAGSAVLLLADVIVLVNFRRTLNMKMPRA